MRKVAIITYYRNNHFGSALQTYALQAVIKEMGYQCENIRYLPNSKFSSRMISLIKNPSKILKKLSRTKELAVYHKVMDFVDQYVDESSDIYKSIDELKLTNSKYDAFVCGSDQIWGPHMFNMWYFISFIEERHMKIAYAPSIGLNAIPDNLKSQMASLIRGIKYLSVREEQGAKIIKELTGIDVPVVLDPTLLINKNKWIDMATKTSIDGKYVLCYFIENSNKYIDAVKRYRHKTGIKTVVLPYRASYDYSWGDIVLENIGPLEFVRLINDATIVFTDSYHGALFSINCNKLFNVFMRFREDDILCQNSRLINILDIVGLSHRLVRGDALEIKDDSAIDYESVNKIIESRVKYSIDYLKTSLSESIRETKNKHLSP